MFDRIKTGTVSVLHAVCYRKTCTSFKLNVKIEGYVVHQGRPNFPNIWEPFRNSRCREGDVKQLPH